MDEQPGCRVLFVLVIRGLVNKRCVASASGRNAAHAVVSRREL